MTVPRKFMIIKKHGVGEKVFWKVNIFVLFILTVNCQSKQYFCNLYKAFYSPLWDSENITRSSAKLKLDTKVWPSLSGSQDWSNISCISLILTRWRKRFEQDFSMLSLRELYLQIIVLTYMLNNETSHNIHMTWRIELECIYDVYLV